MNTYNIYFHYKIEISIYPKYGVVGWCDGAGLTSKAGASY